MKKLDLAYQGKNKDYFENIRHEILPFLPAHANRIFEIGCGAGDTLSFLKSAGRCDWTCGMELFPAAAQSAREKVDLVLEGNIETMDLPFEANSLDVILCLDVLEHLVDPWSVINRLHELLKPNGVLICSIPNVRNYAVVLPLLLFGKWDYSKFGILDKTHLRFFTKETAIKLVGSSGLRVDMVSSTGLKGRAGLANRLTLSLFKPLFEFQYLIRAVKK